MGKKKTKSLLKILEKLPPIKPTIRILFALLVVCGFIGGAYIYRDKLSEQASTVCPVAKTACPLPKECKGVVSYENSKRYCSTSCCRIPTVMPSVTPTQSLPNF